MIIRRWFRLSDGMSGHQSTKMLNDEWLTPPEIFKALGIFDLDPCSPIERPWDTAIKHYSTVDNGLSKKWEGRVWLNPPYGSEAAIWLEKMVEHGDGIALLFARTETRMFFDHVWPYASGLLFLRGRLYFHYVDGTLPDNNAGAPSVLIAYGAENAETLKKSGLDGKFVYIEPIGKQEQLKLFD